ncbi:Fungalysin/Thermolysin Extracellular metalloproteinase 5 [Mortierella sp. GBA35]|nr:Fungalysin/Thermolysin Extracellular metalloproteinase 5 [Mortierella sp. GBA35]
MKFSKTQSYSLLAAMLAVASAHRATIQPFGPELAHKEFHTPSFLSESSNSFGAYNDDHAYFSGSASNPERVALDFVEQKLTDSDYILKSAYTSKHNGVTHVYLRQRVDGLEVINGDINVNREADNLQEQGRQLSFGGWRHRSQRHQNQESFEQPENKDTISPQDALLSFARYLNVEIPRPEDMDIVSTNSLRSDKVEVVMTNCPLTADGKVPVAQAYIQTDDGTLELVYDFQVEMKDTDNWFHVQVNAETGKVMQVVDWVADATYNVFPMGINDPNDGKRKLVKDPHHLPASPLGWNRQSQNKNFTTTVGNNVYAGENRRNGNDWQNNPRPEGTVDEDGELTFDFKLDLKKDPSTYVDAAVTNLFYWNNQVHDVFYHYGFNEEAGNFQENNFGKGGAEKDAVIANAQDGSGYNNANFATPPDGQHGKMRMYVWDVSEKKHHDYESVFDMGSYSNDGQGIRRFSYSTSLETNPSTFKIMDGPQYWGVHAKGEVWAEMLYEVYRNLHLKLPFTEDWYTNDKTSYANTLVLQLVTDGLKLQPCTPSFIQARDAIIQAEKLLTHGKYRCDIWKAFAKRGLGPKAKVVGPNSPWGSVRTESFDLPKTCEDEE